jgi:uncharacterized CHY-type Zn-finger protein
MIFHHSEKFCKEACIHWGETTKLLSAQFKKKTFYIPCRSMQRRIQEDKKRGKEIESKMENSSNFFLLFQETLKNLVDKRLLCVRRSASSFLVLFHLHTRLKRISIPTYNLPDFNSSPLDCALCACRVVNANE